MQSGGDGVNEQQVLSLTREIATIGSKQDTMLEMIREMRQDLQSNYVTKSEHQAAKDAYKREIELLQQANTDRKEKPYKVWMAVVGIICALIGSAPGVIALLIGR